MRKIIYIILFAFVSSICVSACTEEQIVPTENGGGTGSDPKKRP